MWDMHSHLGLYRFDINPNRDKDRHYALNAAELEKTANLETLQACNTLLYPGRRVIPFVLPNPYQNCDCINLNQWAAQEVKKLPEAACTMVVKPEMSADYIDQEVRRNRFLGYKPYMWFSRIANWRESRITDFLTEPQLEVANQYGLIMALHLSKRAAISDPENLDDLARLSRGPGSLAVLHNARSVRHGHQGRPRLRDIPNVFESSSVRQVDVHATFTLLGVVSVTAATTFQ
jgi:glutamate-1-semialdehyde 2,1-aminomutase